MIPKLGDPRYGWIYLIFPMFIAAAFGGPAGDTVLETFGIKPTGALHVIAGGVAGVIFGIAVFVAMDLFSRSGKK